MDTDDILKKPKKDKFLNIIVTEIICVFLLILVVLVTKYFFKVEFIEFVEGKSTTNVIKKISKQNI